MLYGRSCRTSSERLVRCVLFYFPGPATSDIYTLSLHDALPICSSSASRMNDLRDAPITIGRSSAAASSDRKSTRLNSSHTVISYAVFCLKKKNFKGAILSGELFRLFCIGGFVYCHHFAFDYPLQ